MQTRDRLSIGDIENDPDHGGLRAKVQAKHMVIGAGPAEQARIVSRRHWLEIPHRFVEARSLIEIAGDEFDAAHAANEAGRHVAHAMTACVMLSRSADLAF
jgi:hypothetical protein